MKKRLHIPSVLAVAVVLGSAAVAAAVAVTGCDSEGHTRDASVPDDSSGCNLYCIPDGTDAGVCPTPIQCADGSGNCPAGCQPVG